MQNLAIHFGGTEINDFSLLLTFTIGDIIGAIVTFVIAHYFLKIFHGLGRQ